MRVLLVDGDRRLQVSSTLPQELSDRRIQVDSATTPGEGVQLAHDRKYCAIVIEKTEGPCEMIKKLRIDNGTPIVVLRPAPNPDEAIECLESGADDVLSEPINIDELVARLRSLTRRCEPGERKRLKVDDLELDPKALTVKRAGQMIFLTNREFALLEYMMQHHDRVLSRTELADQVWGAEVEWNSNVIDVSVGRLRAKIHLPKLPPLVHTVTGRGYMISDMPPLIHDKANA